MEGILDKGLFEELDSITESFFRYKNKRMEKKYAELPAKMTTTKYRTLKKIMETQNCMVAHIVQGLELSSGATTLLLNNLEEDQLIIRERCSRDRRVVYLELTEKGQDVLQSITKTRNEFYAAIISSLGSREREQFISSLHKVAEGLQHGEV
ncbi:MarR family winged helix-turn-helix transcriptional regulator [Peribacillus sp. SCS-37]|uniref:MarR family winged helix-turn-helix transcriptional regulator n=1 Tax=Paraperibacillus esterisolvens TaxID=3115296 RepID=UPI00390587C8